MASFQYSGVRDGKACSGTIEAPDRRQAITLLAGQSVQLQEIEEKADGGGGAGSGLSLRLEVTREHKRDRWSIDALYGTKVVRPEGVIKIIG